MFYLHRILLADLPKSAVLWILLSAAFSFPLQAASPPNSLQSPPAPVRSSLLGPPRPINPIINRPDPAPRPNPNPNPPPPRPEEPVCPPTLGKPNMDNCGAAVAAIPRDPRSGPVLRNYFVRESDRNPAMENVQLPYESTVG